MENFQYKYLLGFFDYYLLCVLLMRNEIRHVYRALPLSLLSVTSMCDVRAKSARWGASSMWHTPYTELNRTFYINIRRTNKIKNQTK